MRTSELQDMPHGSSNPGTDTGCSSLAPAGVGGSSCKKWRQAGQIKFNNKRGEAYGGEKKEKGGERRDERTRRGHIRPALKKRGSRIGDAIVLREDRRTECGRERRPRTSIFSRMRR